MGLGPQASWLIPTCFVCCPPSPGPLWEHGQDRQTPTGQATAQPHFPMASYPLATTGSAETQIWVFWLHNVKNLQAGLREEGALGPTFTDSHPSPAGVLISNLRHQAP